MQNIPGEEERECVMKKYALTIDHELCWGCKTCEVACKQENNTPDGVRLIAVAENGPREINGDPPCHRFRIAKFIREKGLQPASRYRRDQQWTAV